MLNARTDPVLFIWPGAGPAALTDAEGLGRDRPFFVQNAVSLAMQLLGEVEMAPSSISLHCIKLC